MTRKKSDPVKGNDSDKDQRGNLTQESGSSESESDTIESIHSKAGNQAVKRLYEKGELQATLSVSSPTDEYEQEAERIADQVININKPKSVDDTGGIQRKKTDTNNAVDGELERNFQSVTAGGQPLSPQTRSYFEPRFGQDFSDVRVHTGGKADEAARSIGAEAFTHGKDVVFRTGKYQPKTRQGKKLLAHELTHVVQQQSAKSIHRQSAGQGSQQQDSGWGDWLWGGGGQTGAGGQQQDSGGSTGSGNSQIVRAAKDRAQGDTGDAYNWSPGWFYTPNPDLSGARKNPLDWEKSQGAEEKDDEWIVNWGGGQPTCNVYVYDVLYQTGEDPPRLGNNHYPDAPMSHESAGGYLTSVDRSEIQPGDIFTNGVHMEIITSVSNNGQSFNSAGAHKNGATIDKPSNYATNSGLKFWRV